jgi:hypothetical protein
MTPMKIKDRSDPIPNAGVISGASSQVTNLSEGFAPPTHQSEVSAGPVVAQFHKSDNFQGLTAVLGKSIPTGTVGTPVGVKSVSVRQPFASMYEDRVEKPKPIPVQPQDMTVSLTPVRAIPDDQKGRW